VGGTDKVFYPLMDFDINSVEALNSAITSVSFLFGLHFYPEDADSKFLRNVFGLLPKYTALQLRRSNSSSPSKFLSVLGHLYLD
jgi:hypothetical protein